MSIPPKVEVSATSWRVRARTTSPVVVVVRLRQGSPMIEGERIKVLSVTNVSSTVVVAVIEMIWIVYGLFRS